MLNSLYLKNQVRKQSQICYVHSGPEFLQPVQDIEVAFLFIGYYTIHQEDIYKDQNTTIQYIQFYEYNVANGQVLTQLYMQREISIEKEIEVLQKLQEQENKKL